MLDLGAVTLEPLERARGDGDIAREPERGVPVREFFLAARDGFGSPPPSRGLDEAHPATEVTVGDVACPRCLDLADRLER